MSKYIPNISNENWASELSCAEYKIYNGLQTICMREECKMSHFLID